MKLFLGASILSVGQASHAAPGSDPGMMAPQPNIVFILSDDQGYSDVSWKNEKVKTPNMDKLRQRGMTLDGAYAQPSCTPSRVALLTGKYPWKIGFSGNVIQETAKAGIRLNETLMPQLLKNAGYDTYGYGKWHVGFCDERLRPENRGFDVWHGLMGPGFHYYDHNLFGTDDYWKNDKFHESSLYSTDEFTMDAMDHLDDRVARDDRDPFFMYMAYNAPHNPYQMPTHSELDEFLTIGDKERRDYLAVVYRMDQAIGRLVDKLEQTGFMDNTIIVFQADNGPDFGGNAFPLRGKKSTFVEGGLRVPGFVVGPGIPANSVLDRNEIIHLIDWVPTFLDFAGHPTSDKSLDGYSFKETLTEKRPGPRNELYHNVVVGRKGGIYRKGDFKITLKSSGRSFSWTSNHTIPDEGPCPELELGYTLNDISRMSNNVQASSSSKGDVVLFNIREDPYELVNVYDENKAVGDQMAQALIDASADYAHVKNIITTNANDKETLANKNFPKNSGKNTSGWCKAEDI